MRLLILLFLLLNFSVGLHSQPKVAIIEVDTLTKMLVQEFRVDSIRQAAEVHLKNERSRRLEALKLEIARSDKICFTPSSYENHQQKLRQEYDDLVALDKLVSDSLPLFYRNTLSNFGNIIRSEVRIFMTETRCDVIASTKELLFFSSEINRTEEFYIRLTSQPLRAEFEKITNEYVASLNALMKN